MMKDYIDKNVTEKRRIYYTTILSEIISKDGQYLIAGCKSGKLVKFNLGDILIGNQLANSFESEDELADSQKNINLKKKPTQIVETQLPIYSLEWFQSSNSIPYCLVGSKGLIQVYSFENNDLQFKSSITLPHHDIMVNSLLSVDNYLYAGCGDNNIYLIDFSAQKIVKTLSGHQDYINDLTVAKDGTLFSASEDGSVGIWDTRNNQIVQQIQPYKHETISRPSNGKWIGAVEVDDKKDWLICGGGPMLSLWHLRSLSPSTKFQVSTNNWTPNVSQFHGDYIIAGGNLPNIFVWEINGNLLSQIHTSPSNVYSISSLLIDNEDIGTNQVISAAGTSYKIDICTNWKYKDFELVIA